MTRRMVGIVLTLLSLLFSAGVAGGQTYTQMQWGMNKATTPYQFGANINGAWSNLGTVSSAGVWSIPITNVTGFGTAAAQNIGTSGANVPLLSGVNTWSGAQTFSGGATIPYTQTGTGAVASTVNTKLKDVALTPYDFGAVCDSNGTTGNGNDDTVAIQAAVNAAQTQGKALYLRPSGVGFCRTTSVINITSHVEIIGDSAGDSSVSVPNVASSWLYVDHAGQGVNITISGASIPRGIGITFNGWGIIRNQPAYGPVTTPWTPNSLGADISSTEAEMFVENFFFWNGTDCYSHRGGRLWMNNIRGSCYKTGLDLTLIYDVVRLNNIHFWPYADKLYWSTSVITNTQAYKSANFIAFKLGRVDGIMANNIFTFGAFKDYDFYKDPSDTSGIVSRATFNNIYTDHSVYSIYAEPGAAQLATVQWSNVTLNSWVGAGTVENPYPPAGSQGIHIESPVLYDFSNLEISNFRSNMVYVNNTGGFVLINNLRTAGWNLGATAAPGIYLNNLTSRVFVNGKVVVRVTPPAVAANLIGGPGYVPGEDNFDVGSNFKNALTCSAAFATVGDSVLTCTPTGTFWLRDGRVFYDLKMVITTNAYTTASGALNITTNLPTPLYPPAQIPLTSPSNIVYGAGKLLSGQVTTGGGMNVMVASTGIGATTTGTGYFPASTTFTLYFVGSYQAF